MDNIGIDFNGISINVSLQIGDIAFFQNSSSEIHYIGAVTAIDRENSIINCDINPGSERPTASDFVFFIKDEEINKTGLTGHYGIITLKCNPLDGVNKELFTTSCEVVVSS